MPDLSKFSVVIPAAGSGLRLGGDLPKQFLKHRDKSLLRWSLEPFLELGDFLKEVVVCLPADSLESGREELQGIDRNIHFVVGGDTRQQSVYRGLQHLESLGEKGICLVHDAARPFLKSNYLKKLMAEIAEYSCGALLAKPAQDTLLLGENQQISEVLDRSKIWHAHTPQGAPMEMLMKACRDAVQNKTPVTDESSALLAAGFKVRLVQDDAMNIKITRKEDWDLFKKLH